MDFLTIIPIGIWLWLGIGGILPKFLLDSSEAERRVVFQSIATLAGTTAGLTLTSVSILINLIRTPLGVLDKVLLEGDKRQVGSVFLSALPKLAMTTIIALAAVSLDVLWDGRIRQIGLDIVVLWLASASVLAMARIVWVLRRLLDLSM
ncbi:hypothetical protein SAMN05444745_103292 [Arthrobacter sp. OV608]|nr:hypothetical protein SAMN05444745_103292 [Arthrobacter sp. OV608]